MSKNTKFAKQPIVENLPKIRKTNALSKPVTSNLVSIPQEFKGVNNDKVIAPGMFRTNPSKTSREEKQVPNTVSVSAKTKPITVSQPPVITTKDVNSDVNGLSSTGVENTKTRRPHPRSNTKNGRVPSVSKSSRSKNKEAKVEEHHRNLLLSKNNKHISSACNSSKIDSQDVISKVVCAKCKKCLISVNHDECVRNYVNGKISRGKKQMAKVSFKETQMKYQPKVTKPKKVGTRESLATPKPKKPRFLLRWSPTGKMFDKEGKIVDSSKSKTKSACSNGNLKPLINFIWKFMGTVRFGNDHVAAILGFGDLQWGNILITRVYFIEAFQSLNIIRNIFVLLVSKEKARASHPPKPVPNSRQRLHLLHMDLCGPMRIASINGKRYILVIVDDYSRYTWVHFLRSKDEAPEVIIKFLKRITVLLQSPVIIIRTDNVTEFKNQVLNEYFDTVGISHQMSYVQTPQQNGVVERRNRTLVEAARTMLIFSRAPLFLWAEAIATACFTQNHSIIHRRFNKTPYELISGRKPNISFLHVFGALCYPKNDRKDIGKLGAKGDIGFFIGSGLDLTYAPSTITTQQPSEGKLDLLFEAMYDDYIGGQLSATARTVLPAQKPQVHHSSTASTTIADNVPIPTNSSSLATNIPITSQDVDELNPNAMVDDNTFVNPFANPSTSVATASSSQQNVDPSNIHTFYQPYPNELQWTKDHPLEQTLVEAARTMLIFSRAPLFLWAEAIVTACFTQNRSIIHRRFNKTPYELINGRKPDISFLHVFGALCYPKNDREYIEKLGAKGELDLLFKAMHDDYIGGQSSATARTVLPAQEPQVRQSSTASTSIADTAPIPTKSSSLATNVPITSQDIDELNPNAMVDGNKFVNPFANSSTSAIASSSQQNVDPSNMHTFYQPYPHEFQ
nr:putative ribonuclease H-like domain-containing protein [Tanacetum cinerariifolium]